MFQNITQTVKKSYSFNISTETYMKLRPKDDDNRIILQSKNHQHY